MIGITQEEVGRWRIEIDNAEKFRDDTFGKIKYSDITKAGENIDYFENGVSGRLIADLGLDKNETAPFSTINLIYPIVKNVIPTLYWKNPYINVMPKKQEDEDSAPYASAILNYFYEELDLKNTNKHIIFDAYVLGMGVCKIGYTTRFGTHPTEENIKQEQKDRKKGLIQKTKELLGLSKPKEDDEPVQNPELNEFIRAESPFVSWVSPFDFGIDPAANSIYNARYVFQKITKILKQVKENKNYSNTKNLKGSPMSDAQIKDIPETQIENFKTIDLYEIHYKTEEGIRILTLAKDGNGYEALAHEDSIYNMDGFMFEVLHFNKHLHRLYPKSDVDIIKGLQDRTTTTFDNILNQLDKFVPKLLVNETAMTAQGKSALLNGDIGAICYTNQNPNEVAKEFTLTQIKADLTIFIDKLLEMMMLETGLTRAQLMGMSNAQTATEAQIAQGGQNLRLSDKFDMVADFANKQARKLWQVIQQFVDLQEINLITGERGIDEVTGMAKYSWMPDISSNIAEKLAKGEYRFQIEVSAMEKPDLPVLRQQLERMGGLLSQQGVMQAFQMQGYKINLAELFKYYLRLYPDLIVNVGKIIQPITQNSQGLMPQGMPQGGGNQMSQQSMNPPNIADILSGAGGERGQGVVPGA